MSFERFSFVDVDTVCRYFSLPGLPEGRSGISAFTTVRCIASYDLIEQFSYVC